MYIIRHGLSIFAVSTHSNSIQAWNYIYEWCPHQTRQLGGCLLYASTITSIPGPASTYDAGAGNSLRGGVVLRGVQEAERARFQLVLGLLHRKVMHNTFRVEKRVSVVTTTLA